MPLPIDELSSEMGAYRAGLLRFLVGLAGVLPSLTDKTKQNKTKQDKTKHNTTQHNTTQHNTTKQNKTKQNKTKQNQSNQNKIFWNPFSLINSVASPSRGGAGRQGIMVRTDRLLWEGV
jgi:hypothetical protein